MVFDWVEKLRDEDRRNYYNTKVPFKCPCFPRPEGWRIRDCLDHCDYTARDYREFKRGAAAFLICAIDEGERDLETGKRTRNL